MKKTAYFVEYPARIEMLWRPHLITQEKQYRVVKQITLSAIDYENFITDMRVDRQFLHQMPERSAKEGVMQCLFITRRKRADGVLVVPESEGYVGWAAYIADISA